MSRKPKPEKIRQISITIDNNALAWIKTLAGHENRSLSNMVACIMRDLAEGHTQ